MAKVFEAQWGGGKCPECSDPIERGDWVSYIGDLLTHEECGAPAQSYDDLTQDWPDED